MQKVVCNYFTLWYSIFYTIYKLPVIAFPYFVRFF